ncbi:MAG: hypothetical protein M1830_005966, partial [Pleopsidium flavum]
MYIRTWLVTLTLTVSSFAIPVTDPSNGIGLVDRALSKRTPLVYIGFDSKNKNDVKHKGQIEQAWKNSLELMSYVLTLPDTFTGDIFKHYFDPVAADPVKKVFQNMHGGNDASGSPNLGLITIRNDDFNVQCAANLKMFAYTQSNYKNGHVIGAQIHICERAYQLKTINEIKCAELGDTVSYKMTTLGSVLLHEYTHFDVIGKAATGSRIVDYGEDGYGPLATRTLDKAKAFTNADSYTWFAN